MIFRKEKTATSLIYKGLWLFFYLINCKSQVITYVKNTVKTYPFKGEG